MSYSKVEFHETLIRLLCHWFIAGAAWLDVPSSLHGPNSNPPIEGNSEGVQEEGREAASQRRSADLVIKGLNTHPRPPPRGMTSSKSAGSLIPTKQSNITEVILEESSQTEEES